LEKTTYQKSLYYGSLIEANLDPMVILNNEGEITDLNRAMLNITGLEKATLLGSKFLNYFTDHQKALAIYEGVLSKGAVSDSPLTICHKDGLLTDVQLNGSVCKDENENILGIVIVARDVTEQQILSKYSHSLIEASLDPLVTINMEGKITDMNEATVNITGITRKGLTGSDFFDYFTEPQKAREVYQEVFANGSVSDCPLTLVNNEGKLTDVLFNGSVYKDERGNVLGVVIVARDVTEQKIIATELRVSKVFAELATEIAEKAKSKAESATRTAEDAVKAKQQFLSNMSHEIRTPMNAIIGFTKVVLKTELSEKQREYLTAIKTSGDALIVLINDILDLAKVDAGKMTFEQTAFKPESSISAMLHLFEPKILEKNLVLVKEYDERIPKTLVGDPVRLHQIILNLVSNAIKFTEKGTVTVSVRLLEEDEEKVKVEFSITDTGIGISKNKIGKIFENFQQATSGTSRLYGGTGLGLAIVKKLIESQQGSINVISKANQGSTFSFRLNFLKTKFETEAEIELAELNKEIKNIRVLVVEDIQLNQLLMKTLLEDFGFGLDIAENGKVAIELLNSNHYDIILMDLQMPEMNGFEATKHIRNIMNSKIPIIALTADVTSIDVAKCKEVGMNDYISKPVDERLLYSKIMKTVKKALHKKTKDNDSSGSDNTQCTNLNYLTERTKSNPKLMTEMITLYLNQTPTLVSEMKKSMEAEDWKMLKAAAHKMIPSFSIMGISKEFENMAKDLQDFAGAEPRDIEKLKSLVLQLEHVFLQSCKELTAELEVIKSKEL
jgi:PAS domain S-box-containing protein